MFWSWLHGELGSIISHITHILHFYISHNPSVAGCFSRQMLAAHKYSKIHRQFRCKTHVKWCISRCQTKYCIHCCAYTSTKNMEVLMKQLAIVPGVLQFEISCWIPLMFQPIYLTVVEQRYTDLWKFVNIESNTKRAWHDAKCYVTNPHLKWHSKHSMRGMDSSPGMPMHLRIDGRK